jgi:hypothetical protein
MIGHAEDGGVLSREIERVQWASVLSKVAAPDPRMR